MLAVHFGAGNIGRGFIGKLLADAGYDIVFADVNRPLIDDINSRGKYDVLYAEEAKRSFTVSGITGLHSQENEAELVNAIIQADLITTAVGAHILPHIAPVIAKGLEARAAKSEQPLNVIACENALNGSDQLKEAVFSHVHERSALHIDRIAGFPNAAVDRIVPDQNQENPLDVLVEPFFEWAVDKKGVKGGTPAVDGIHFTDDLDAYIERKLFTVNTGHALAAYAGYRAGRETVHEALNDPAVLADVKAGLQDTGRLICEKHGFNHDEHQAYIDKILSRFTNPFIVDKVTRVARQPIKKLGGNERLISPARQLTDMDITPDSLIKGIVAALKYDYAEDAEAVTLQENIAAHGIAQVFCDISGLDEDDALVTSVVESYEKSTD